MLAILAPGCGTGTTPAAAPSLSPAAMGSPAKLAFTIQPGGAAAGSGLSTPPAVAIQDANGNTVTSSGAAVKLTITAGTGTGGAILFGPSTINTVNGIARFKDLSIDKAGTGFSHQRAF
jgi:hypothetical protein